MRMNPYSDEASTLNECEEIRVEKPVKESLTVIRKELLETDAVLKKITGGIIGAEPPKEEIPEPNNMQEELYMIVALSERCMGAAYRLDQLIFG